VLQSDQSNDKKALKNLLKDAEYPMAEAKRILNKKGKKLTQDEYKLLSDAYIALQTSSTPESPARPNAFGRTAKSSRNRAEAVLQKLRPRLGRIPRHSFYNSFVHKVFRG
jgi:hypothetical protein